MLYIQLFTKDPCPLCDDVKRLLDAVQETYPHQLEEVDITQDHDLNVRYRYEIPVLQIGEKRLKAPIGMAELNTFLSEAV